MAEYVLTWIKTNESADHETASFWSCFPQCLFAVHHGNSLVYAFTEVSIKQTIIDARHFVIFYKQIFVLTKEQTETRFPWTATPETTLPCTLTLFEKGKAGLDEKI